MKKEVKSLSVKFLLVFIMALLTTFNVFSLGLSPSSITLVYYLYYDDIRIMYVEVLVQDNDIELKVVPLIEGLPIKFVSSVSKLIMMPSKTRFIVGSVNDLIKLVKGTFDVKEVDKGFIIKYNIEGIERISKYIDGVLTYEENRVDNHSLVLKLVAILEHDLQQVSLIETAPFAIIISGLGLYAYLNREKIRIL